jgi:tetratricopeptide (TPR) repeat protein
MQGDGPPVQVEEMALDLYERGDLDRAEAAFRLLLDCFGGYADGHNHLGLVALDRGEVIEAIDHFAQAVDLGRRRFPKRIAKDRLWNDLDTRPYVRALRNLAGAFSRLGRDCEALEVCAVLEGECGDSLTAAAFRAPIHLRAGRYEEALRTAKPLSKVWADLSFVAAFAFFELDQAEEALVSFLHGALNRPLSARRLVGRRSRAPRDWQEARDHSEGIDVQRDLEPYLMGKGKRSRRFFWRVLGLPQVDAMLDEIVHARQRNHHQHQRGRREAFDRVTQMETPEYARERAAELMPLLGKKTGRR